MTRAGEKLYRIWEPRPPRDEHPLWLWIAVAVIIGMLIVGALSGNW